MQLLSQTTAPRESRSVVPMDGYVHKFRLEACEEAAAERRPQLEATPTVSVGSLLGKLALSALALLGIAAAGARALI
ncbi:hypothetical protein JM946_14115 [Steroidobacter sp. S1-65]|uniref:Uncharacterized protein n=1 Tax=Steroidobacter gossypii TaxID=2805490 RepID=A0ABS1WY58_9GAMM|nr:hypothetical protein [Steroidobacter gossypii]MBM0105867.1 hypothetical protein [Steroidobacter gossypii]